MIETAEESATTNSLNFIEQLNYSIGDFRGLFRQIPCNGTDLNKGGVAPVGCALHSVIMNHYLLLSSVYVTSISIA